MKHLPTFSIAMVMALAMNAETVNVTTLKYAGPFTVRTPYQVDSLDVNACKFDRKSLLDTHVDLGLAASGKYVKTASLPASGDNAIHLLSFSVDNRGYTSGSINVEGIDDYKVYVDGTPADSRQVSLTPALHNIVVKCLSEPGKRHDLKITVDTTTPDRWDFSGGKDRRYTLMDAITGKRIAGATLSPSGKYLLESFYFTDSKGDSEYSCHVVETSSGRQILSDNRRMEWMPGSDLLFFTRQRGGDSQMVTLDPASHEQKILVNNLPEGYVSVSPSEDFLIISQVKEGPKENPDVYEVVHPEDRQPGWRDRVTLVKYDLKSGIAQPLTFGYKGASLLDISHDGGKILFAVNEPRLGRRPTTVTSVYMMDTKSLETVRLLDKEDFIGMVRFSPDASKAVISATPEAFASIGKNVKEGQTPSMVDNQLYILDIKSGGVTPLTKFFNPSVQQMEWSAADGLIYFSAEDRDRISLFRLDPSSGEISSLDSKEDVVAGFSLASSAPVMTYFGQGAVNSDRLYTIDLSSLDHKLIDDVSAERLAGIKIGKCEQWDYVTSRGDTINARYVLPADFDPSVKYPMIVNYYGGCSPTSRNFESRYPHHAYTAQGYVVLVINPSGASGFGQEFSARHVNTAGEGVAEDIIEGVRQFTASHPFINADKIGCIGASYGGFMTQYLQTKTDIFAAAISHAGISDHTSYWGEGYWGYSYSEVSMANSYPWKDPDLFVNQSPLFNADKIHTPILFLHGDADMNVPVGESIQMYTALKLLDRPTAFVAVKDQDHHIIDFEKRKKWQDTIFAWFAKYLQDDPSWWEAMYPTKML